MSVSFFYIIEQILAAWYALCCLPQAVSDDKLSPEQARMHARYTASSGSSGGYHCPGYLAYPRNSLAAIAALLTTIGKSNTRSISRFSTANGAPDDN
jgi:hypothetical protein